jgi:tRNA (adenine37-N6)-methyltransferase
VCPKLLAFLKAIGTVKSSRKSPEDDHWDSVESSIELDPSSFKSSALDGLATFSHVEIIFHMHQVEPSKIETEARHPRNNTEWPKVGIFAQRGKNRPNQIGTTICQIKKLEGTTLHLIGLDAIDGTPVLDIKPWVKEFGPRGEVKQPSWITELMTRYWK